jgi:hypothetical protein
MNTSQRTWIFVLLVLPLWLAGCTPVEEPNTASISGGVYFDCDKDGECAKHEVGIADMCVRLYFGGCGENLLQTHKTDENGEFLFSELAAGEYCVFPDFEFKTCGFDGNFPTTPISRHVTLESGMRADLVWFGFGTLSGKEEPADQ